MFSIFRLIKILVTLLPLLPSLRRDFSNGITTPEISKKFRLKLQKLGPAFVKFGQMLSLRYDFIPLGYCEELQNLLDQGEVVPFKEYAKLLEKGLNIKLADRFRNIDIDPVGCASLAQVHTGYLNDGTKVAVKVLRPGVRKTVKRDIRLLKILAKVLSNSNTFKRIRFELLVDEFARWTEKELDLKIEGQNCDTFRENFKGDDDVKIPSVFWEATNKTVLTMEFIEGVSIREFIKIFAYSKQDTASIQGVKVSREKLASVMTRALFKQILEHGFFHGDPHPANMVFIREGKIAFLDFGIVGEFSEVRRRILSDLVLAIAEKDTQNAMKYIIAFDQIEGVENIEQLKSKVEHILGHWQTKKISQFSATQGLAQLVMEGAQAGIEWPVEMLLLSKLMITLDGITQKIYPNYKLFEEFKPHIVRSKQKGLIEDVSTKKFVAKFNEIIEDLKNIPVLTGEVLTKINKGELSIITKEDERNLRLKQKSLKIITLLVFNVSLFCSNIYLITKGITYPVFASLDLVSILALLNIFFFVVIIVELFKD